MIRRHLLPFLQPREALKRPFSEDKVTITYQMVEVHFVADGEDPRRTKMRPCVD